MVEPTAPNEPHSLGSIRNRKEVIAPTHFVSVYHELRDITALDAIDREGLQVSPSDLHGYGMARRNALIDFHRTEALRAKGARRKSVYACPSIKNGSGFSTLEELQGRTLEMKVDPRTCFVGDMEQVSRIQDRITFDNMSEEAAVERYAPWYWKGMITLEDFLKWYDEGEQGFSKKPAAPKELPTFELPEILIPYNIPQEHIKLV